MKEADMKAKTIDSIRDASTRILGFDAIAGGATPLDAKKMIEDRLQSEGRLARQFTERSDRDWPEDSDREPGPYTCKCQECEQYFTGHKRRQVCRACHAKGNA